MAASWRRLDGLIAAGLPSRGPMRRTRPSAAERRAALREADRIIAWVVRTPPRPRGRTGSIDAVVLHPVAGPALPPGILFAAFQAVFAGAAPPMDGTRRAFDDRRDRPTTILIAPLTTCSARPPVCTLLVGAFVPTPRLAGGIG